MTRLERIEAEAFGDSGFHGPGLPFGLWKVAELDKLDFEDIKWLINRVKKLEDAYGDWSN